MIRIYVQFVFYNENVENLSCEDHIHPCTEITFNFAGSGTIFSGDVSWDWTPNSIHIYQPGKAHRVVKTGIGTELCLGVSGLGINKLPASVFMADDKLINLFSQLYNTMKTPTPMHKEWIELLSAMICVEIIEQHEESLIENESTTADTIRLIIDSNLKNRITISDLAAELHMSKAQLHQVFKEKYGVSPVQYCIQKRIDYACSLLEDAESSIKYVAKEIGFNDPYHFSKLFKKVKGVSPNSYKDAYHNKV